MTLASVATGKDGELSLNDLIGLGLFPQFGSSSVSSHSSPPVSSPDLFSAIGAVPADTVGAEEPPPGKAQRRKKLAGSPLRLMIRVDMDALLRGVAFEGELCDIPGYGPVPVSVVEELIATENPFIIGLLTKGDALTGVYHHGRHPNAHQRSALDFLQPICAAEGCPARAGLQYDHRLDYAKTKITAFDLLDRLCLHHHNLKTHKNWSLIAGRGKRSFVPPEDPRHPGHGPAPPDPTS